MRTLTFAQQGACLRWAQPDSSLRFVDRGRMLIWIGRLRPTALSNRYQVRMVAHRSWRRPPVVYVESPPLVTRNGEEPPHLYPSRGATLKSAPLCLWHPKKAEWSPQLRLVDTVLPWAAEWLFYYEIWLATGEWVGGGEHPSAPKSPIVRRLGRRARMPRGFRGNAGRSVRWMRQWFAKAPTRQRRGRSAPSPEHGVRSVTEQREV